MMKTRRTILMLIAIGCLLGFTAAFDDNCGNTENKTATAEQSATEQNQTHLLQVQPPPRLDWSLERDNLTKRFKLQNDRAQMFYMYVFVPGVPTPIAYYQVNKVSSVDSHLTNPQQIVRWGQSGLTTLPSPDEDGSYGTNGNGVFGFTPEEVYVEHNMLYLVTTVPVAKFNTTAIKIGTIDTDEAKKLLEASKAVMAK